jgi:hypothetical protein
MATNAGEVDINYYGNGERYRLPGQDKFNSFSKYLRILKRPFTKEKLVATIGFRDAGYNMA